MSGFGELKVFGELVFSLQPNPPLLYLLLPFDRFHMHTSTCMYSHSVMLHSSGSFCSVCPLQLPSDKAPSDMCVVLYIHSCNISCVN